MLTLPACCRIRLFILGILVISGTPVVALESPYAIDSPFLPIQTDIRSRGMGEVGAVLPDNPMGFLFNPACLADANIVFGRFSRAEWWPTVGYLDRETYAIAAGLSLGPWVNIGAAMHRFDWGPRPLTDEWGVTIGHYFPYEYAIYIGYAARPAPWISAGLNVKYIRMAVGKYTSKYYTADGIGFDIGLVFRDPGPDSTHDDQDIGFEQALGKFGRFIKAYSHPRSRGFLFGIALLNIGPNIKSEEAEREYPLPHSLRMGFSWQLVDTDPIGVLGAADFDYSFGDKIETIDKDTNYHIGAEINLWRLITLRGGYVSMAYDSPDYATMGASLGVDRAHVDVSYIPKSEKASLFAKTFAWGLTVNW